MKKTISSFFLILCIFNGVIASTDQTLLRDISNVLTYIDGDLRNCFTMLAKISVNLSVLESIKDFKDLLTTSNKIAIISAVTPALFMIGMKIYEKLTAKKHSIHFLEKLSHSHSKTKEKFSCFEKQKERLENEIENYNNKKFLLIGNNENGTHSFAKYYAKSIKSYYLEVNVRKLIDVEDQYRKNLISEIQGLDIANRLLIFFKNYNKIEKDNKDQAVIQIKKFISRVNKIQGKKKKAKQKTYWFMQLHSEDIAMMLINLYPFGWRPFLFKNPDFELIKMYVESKNSASNQIILNNLSKEPIYTYKEINMLIKKASKITSSALENELKEINQVRGIGEKIEKIEKNAVDYIDYKDKKIAHFVVDNDVLKDLVFDFEIFYSNDENINQEKKTMSVTPPKGYLLYGPPGTGKSFFVKYIASKLGALYREVNVADVLNCFVGNSEKYIKATFNDAMQKSKNQLTVLFFDEFDSFAKRRNNNTADHSRTLANSFLPLLVDSREYDNLIIFAATNCTLKELDEAMIRDGRFDKKIEFKFPTEDGRKQKIIFSLNVTSEEHDDLISYLVSKTENCTYAKIEKIISEANQNLFRNRIKNKISRDYLTRDDFAFPKEN